MAAKLKKIIQLTKKNDEKMKKLMFIFNLILSVVMLLLTISYTIGSLIVAGMQSYHIALFVMCLLFATLVKLSYNEYVEYLNEQ